MVVGSGEVGSSALCSNGAAFDVWRSTVMRTLALTYCGFSDLSNCTFENLQDVPLVNLLCNVWSSMALPLRMRAPPRQYSRGSVETRIAISFLDLCSLPFHGYVYLWMTDSKHSQIPRVGSADCVVHEFREGRPALLCSRSLSCWIRASPWREAAATGMAAILALRL